MRKIFTLIAALIMIISTAKSQYVNIPDSNFRNDLKLIYPSCFNASNQLDTSCSEIVNEDFLNIRSVANNLEGIQYFKGLKYLELGSPNLENVPNLPTSLTYLNLSGSSRLISLPSLTGISLDSLVCMNCTQLTSLPQLPSSLTYLQTYSTPLSSLPVLPNGLRILHCFSNALTTLPNLPDSLRILYCGWQVPRMTSLPSLPAFLEVLECENNSITSLPALPNSLKQLLCSGNNISNLPTLPTNLEYLACSQNQLTQLPSLPAHISTLACSVNPLENLPDLPASLTNLQCYRNLLTSLPTLPPNLQFLWCPDNVIRVLPQLPSSLRTLDCSSNQLTELPSLPDTMLQLECRRNNINCLPRLPQAGATGVANPSYTKFELFIDTAKIKCLPNLPQADVVKVYPNRLYYPGGDVTAPFCSPLNNANNCVAFPSISGYIFYDANNNDVKDAEEFGKANGKIILSNGDVTYTNNEGYYQLSTDSIGAYSIIVTPPQYFNTSPAVNFYFTAYDTLTVKDIPLQANIIVDELSIKITPINMAARPGFSFPYMISYENTGTTTLSPNILFDYDETRIYYNTSSIAGVVDNTNTLTYSPGSLTPGENGSYIGYFTLKTTVPLGDTLNAGASITANSFTVYDNARTIVRGACDPNDKQATPQLSPSQVSNGEYIDYTIRFQNTGTDTAFTVVISDTLSDDLQTNSLQMIASSHNCKATVKDNIVFFEFLDILLPDSNVNEPMSHGFVSFRIKPQTTVAVNTIIPNKAAIYFDYNAPVITNTAGTLIKEFTVVPLKLISFNAVPQNDNTTSLYWNTANEINTKHFVIERSYDGLRFSSLTNIVAKGKANNNYNATVADANTGFVFYRLKIVDNDGSFVYSPIIKIDKRKNAAGFSVLSNPVKDVLVISTTDRTLNHTSAGIVTMQGVVVKTFVIKEGSQTIEVKDLPPGVYYLRTVNGSNRFLKQ